jgi:hypothetical protein
VVLGWFVSAARVRNPLALLSPKLELSDRTGRQLRQESFETLDDVESSQRTDERNELHAEAGLDALDGALADTGSLGKLSLGQARFDAVPCDSLAEDLGDGGIR